MIWRRHNSLKVRVVADMYPKLLTGMQRRPAASGSPHHLDMKPTSASS